MPGPGFFLSGGNAMTSVNVPWLVMMIGSFWRHFSDLCSITKSVEALLGSQNFVIHSFGVFVTSASSVGVGSRSVTFQ